MTFYTLSFVALALVIAVFGLLRSLGAYRKFRGNRIISCPENHRPAAVRVAAAKAPIQAATGTPHLPLSECSRWPEMAGCGQECLSQIQEAPKACTNLGETVYDSEVQADSAVSLWSLTKLRAPLPPTASAPTLAHTWAARA